MSVKLICPVLFQDSEKTVLPCMDEDSVVEHLICTQLSLGSDPAPVLGLAVHYPPTSLIVLLSNFTAQSLALSPPYFGAPPPLLSSKPDQSSSALSTSPLKNRGGTSGQEQQQFEQKIKQILQKSSKHPLVKAGANVNPSKQECLELLMMSTQTLREEYLVRLEQARVEIDRRVSHLQGQKTSQSKSLAVLGRERQGLRDKAGDLSEKYEDIKDNGDRITRR